MHSLFCTYIQLKNTDHKSCIKGSTGSIPNNEVKTYMVVLCLKNKHNPVAAMGTSSLKVHEDIFDGSEINL